MYANIIQNSDMFVFAKDVSEIGNWDFCRLGVLPLPGQHLPHRCLAHEPVHGLRDICRVHVVVVRIIGNVTDLDCRQEGESAPSAKGIGLGEDARRPYLTTCTCRQDAGDYRRNARLLRREVKVSEATVRVKQRAKRSD